MTNPPHPPDERLANYALGKLSGDELESISRHVEECESCISTIARLDVSQDTLVEALRTPSSDTEPINTTDLAAAIDRALQAMTLATPEPGDQGSFGGKASGRSLGGYELMEPIGHGGMGTVYRARHPKLGRLVALKLLPPTWNSDPNRVARFEREMQAVGAMEHENIVRAYDAGEAEGQHYLAMELLEGIDLRELVRSEGILPVADACEVIRQAALGLAHADQRGLVHRDVKPSNLMLTREGVIKVLDLGLASLTDDALTPNHSEESASSHPDNAAAASLTQSGHLLGTPDFMSPEQCRDVRNIDIRSDLFSLGATLYFLLTTRPPYSGREFDTIGKKIAGAAAALVPSITLRRPDLPAEVVAALERLLARTPAERFQTPAEVAKAFAPLATGSDLTRYVASSVADRPSNSASELLSQTTDYRRRMPRSPWNRLAVGAGVAAALLAAVIVTVSTPEGRLVIDVPVEIRDDVHVEVHRGGASVAVTAEQGWSVALEEGEWKVHLRDPSDSFEIEKDEVTIQRGKHQVVRVLFQPSTDDRPDASPPSPNPTSQKPARPTIALADPDRSESSIQCDLFTRAYEVQQRGIVNLPGVRWKVLDAYLGRRGAETVVDDRITVVLNDEGRRFWPVISKLSVPIAVQWHAQLGQLLESAPKGDGSAEDQRVDAILSTASYDIDSYGRIALRTPMEWMVQPPKAKRTSSDEPKPDNRPRLVLRDREQNHDAVVAKTPWSAIRRLHQDLGAAIHLKQAATEQRVAFRTREGFFVGAVKGGGDDVRADRRERRTSEVFTLEWLDVQRNRANIRTRDNYYLHAEKGGGGDVDAVAKAPKTSEVFTFEWLDARRTRARIRTRDGYYLHASDGGGGDVDARVKNPETSEVFTILPVAE